MSRKISAKTVKKNLILSLSVQIVSIVVSFVMNLIVPKCIDELQYSHWQAYMLYVGYVGVLHFGLLDGMMLRYSQYDLDELDQPRIRSQFAALLCINSVMAILVALVTAVIGSGAMRSVFFFVAAGIVFKNLFTYASYTFQMTNRVGNYAALIIAQKVFFGISTLLLLLLKVEDFRFYCLSELLSDVFGCVFCFKANKELYIGKLLPLKEALNELKINMSSGIVLLIANWSSMLLVGSAKMIIQWHWDDLTFGKVSFSFSITNLFLTFVTAISIVLFPSIKRMKQEELPKLYRNIRNLMSPVLFFLMIGYFPGCLLLEWWLPKYNSSLSYLGLLLPIIIYTSKVSLLTNNYLKAYRKELSMLIVNVSAIAAAFLAYLLSAYVFDNLSLLLIMVVFVIMGRSIASEIVVMKLINIRFTREFIIEAVMTAVFIISAKCFPFGIGFVVYFIAATVYFILNRETIIPYFKKLKLRRK